MSTPEILTARELATHAADIKHMQEDMDKMLETMKSMQNMLTDINVTLSEAKGGWKVLMLVGGAAGTVGAGIVQVAHWWSK
jgi:ribosomal protein S5